MTDEKRFSDALARLRRYAPCELGAPEAFRDELAPASYFDWWPRHIRGRKGPTSEAVTRRIVSSCAGWPRRPNAGEFYDAVRAQQPTADQKALVSMWAVEATRIDLFDSTRGASTCTRGACWSRRCTGPAH